MLRIHDLTLSYGHRVLLEEASFSCSPGEIVGLVAPNGYGKTTLLRAMAGLAGARVRGTIKLTEVAGGGEAAARRLVFYAPGDASLLYPSMTARAHLNMARRLWRSGIDVEKILDACAIRPFARKHVRVCSQGMKQQLTLGIALATGARYLLLDEPMNALDPTNVQRVTALLRHEAQRGRCIVLSSHILDSVDRIADRILFIHERHLIARATGEHVTPSYDTYRKLYGSFESDASRLRRV